MFSGTLIFMTITWLVMLGGFLMYRFRTVHVSIMGSLIVVDFCFPLYLFLTRDLIRRFFEEGEILSFLLWLHLMLIITLYTLYVVQIQAGRRLLRGDQSVRSEHRGQAIGILVTRALVIATGGLLAEPAATGAGD